MAAPFEAGGEAGFAEADADVAKVDAATVALETVFKASDSDSVVSVTSFDCFLAAMVAARFCAAVNATPLPPSVSEAILSALARLLAWALELESMLPERFLPVVADGAEAWTAGTDTDDELMVTFFASAARFLALEAIDSASELMSTSALAEVG